MDKVTTITSRTVVLPVENVDTDQIIPARFLKATSKVGLGTKLFADWRFDAAGQPKPDFILNRPEAQGEKEGAPRPTVLVAGDNFGCGSSREHAPWALHDFGFRAVVSTSIADIFRNNALKNGIVPVVVPPSVHAKLLADPGGEVTISVADQSLTLRDGTRVTFPIDPFASYCLLNGVDELEFLLSQADAIAAFEARRASS
jgi:3-isopropylmalate/(R)-2-methylmalate dehydratase small subunit